jgi:integrase
VPRSKERVPPGPAELTRLLEFADPDFALFLRLAIVTGARRGEVLALRWRDVDEQSLLIARALTYTPERGVVEKDPKGHRARRQGLDPRTRDLLAKHALAMHERAHLFSTALTDDAFVFSAEPDCSAPWHPDTVSKRFERLRRRAKVQCTLHDLRHAAMTLLIAGGVDVKAVQQFAGHAHASLTLDVYAHHQQVGTRLAELLAGEIDGVTDPRAS